MADCIIHADALIVCNALKEEGNAYLVLHKYALAADKYTEAISLLPNSIYYSNRKQAATAVSIF